MFGPWKCVNYKLQSCGQSQTTRNPPPCAPPAIVMLIGENTTLYPRLLRQPYWSEILVSVSVIRSKPPICTACIACEITYPWPSWMLRVPRNSTWGCSVCQCGGSGVMCRRSLPWMISWERQLGLLVWSLENTSCIDLHIFYGRYDLVI